MASCDKLPKYSIARIIQLRNKLLEPVVRKYGDITLDNEDILLLNSDLHELLPAGIDMQPIYQSTAYLANRNLDEHDWQIFCWRLAANVTALSKGCPVLPWKAPGSLEWAPLQVVRVDPAATRKGEHRWALKLRVLAGTACPLTFVKTVTLGWAAYLSRMAGFTTMHGTRPYTHIMQLVGLRFFGLLDPALSRNNLPMMNVTKLTQGFITYNTKMINMRYRHGFKCPKDFTHDCHICAVGMRECPAATHLMTYVKKYCSVCDRTTWFDPELQTNMCLMCYRRQATTSQN